MGEEQAARLTPWRGELGYELRSELLEDNDGVRAAGTAARSAVAWRGGAGRRGAGRLGAGRRGHRVASMSPTTLPSDNNIVVK